MTLWCTHIPGPDDIFAAPDRTTADIRAAEHNAFVTRKFWEDPDPNDPPLEAGLMAVIEWPWDAASHAKDLAGNVFARVTQ